MAGESQVLPGSVPDPSVLTTEQLLRQKDDIMDRVLAMLAIRDVRIDGMVTADNILTGTVDKMPMVIEKEVGHLEEKFIIKFESIALQFIERDVRTDQAAIASDQALKAALQAAKELVTAQGEASAAAADKSEVSFTKQLDQIGNLIATLDKSINGRIDELKERIDRGEGGQVAVQTVTDNRAQSSNIQIALVGLIIAIIVAAVTVAIALQ